MLIYRIQAFPPEAPWITIWRPTMPTARTELAKFKSLGHEARIDKVDVPSGREALCYVLNHAHDNHMNLDGELIDRV